MESPPVFLAGPFPVLHSSRVVEDEDEVELDVGLIIQGQPTILASTCFALDADWSRIEVALASGDAQLGVAGMPYVDEEESVERTYPSAYIGLQCANGERLVLTHIRGLDATVHAEAYAKDVIRALLNGLSPDELGETIE
ncbi:MAG TPA: hypothetical protein VM100_10740 [Longimicrobiales bacterium]|nr:hypothetical protein [Longimicrobiales bacterium]